MIAKIDDSSINLDTLFSNLCVLDQSLIVL